MVSDKIMVIFVLLMLFCFSFRKVLCVLNLKPICSPSINPGQEFSLSLPLIHITFPKNVDKYKYIRTIDYSL